MRKERIRAAASRFTRRLDIRTLPVDVDAFAAAAGLPVVRESLDAEIAGALILTPDGPVACLNRDQPRERQRVMLAHLIGHVQLGHRFHGGARVHVDRGFEAFRSERQYTAAERQDFEANVYGGWLLTPAALLDAAVAERGNRRLTDDDIQALAAAFGVSVQGMTLRLSVVGKI
ncbi:MAG: ImmA/IrrE family metallo-endopeptidase [Vicinamibacterales bacterium]